MNGPVKPETLFVTSADTLAAVCQQIQGAAWMTMDTEFIREKTYYPKLCLIQIGTLELTACIDPLVIPDLTPLYQLLDDTTIIKVLHACHQDMEIFYHLRGKLPEPVFDTQLAAPLLGYPVQAGYARLVQDILGIQLEKTQTRSDWQQRPLSQAQLTYAGDDVIYLGQIYASIRDALIQRGRLPWLADDFAALSVPTRYEQPPAEAWCRIRHGHRLKPRQATILKALAEWREKKARVSDIPRNWIIRDEVLSDIAIQKPVDIDALQSVRGLKPATVSRYGETLLTLIDTAIKGPVITMQHQKSVDKKLLPAMEAQVEALMAIAEYRANEHDLHQSILVTRKELANLVLGKRDIAVLQGWKRAILGNDLLDFLAGKIQLRITDNALLLEGTAE